MACLGHYISLVRTFLRVIGRHLAAEADKPRSHIRRAVLVKERGQESGATAHARRVFQRRALSVFLQGWQCAAGFRGGRHLLCDRRLRWVLASTMYTAAGSGETPSHCRRDNGAVSIAITAGLLERHIVHHELQPTAILVPERTVVRALSVRLVDILRPAPRPTRTAADLRAHPRRVQLLNISTRRCGGQGCRQGRPHQKVLDWRRRGRSESSSRRWKDSA